ncbi:MAG: hypothetical protein KBA95_18030 [Acidobacteria bacterium]|nr:hypothetical protein [Acidobacteriota bacterium]
MSFWRTISAAEIAQRAPICTRLMRKIRLSMWAAKCYVLTGVHSGNGARDDGSSGTWTTAETWSVYVPSFVIGDTGTRLTVLVDLAIANGTPGAAKTSYWRLVFGSDVSTTVTVTTSAGNAGRSDEPLVLTMTAPTGDAINSIAVQGLCSLDDAEYAELLWATTRCDGRLEAV